MDAFYASIEQRDNPSYRGKPIIVGGLPEKRGVVAAASYEARKFGICSGMPTKIALKLCPNAAIIYPRVDIYKKISKHIREIFQRYTDLIEPLSIDEAYLDVTTDKKNIGYSIEIAKQIKQAIKEELRLTASAGISINKFVAKIASGMQKPDGLTFVSHVRIEAFMEALPVEKFHGVGIVMANKMKRMGLHTGADLKKLSELALIQHFGKIGKFYYEVLRGIDDRPVNPNKEIKSISAESTFLNNLTSWEEIYKELDKIAVTIYERLTKKDLQGRTITLKVRYADFTRATRSKSFAQPFNDLATIQSVAKRLMARAFYEGIKIGLLGIGFSNFNKGPTGNSSHNDDRQLKLF